MPGRPPRDGALALERGDEHVDGAVEAPVGGVMRLDLAPIHGVRAVDHVQVAEGGVELERLEEPPVGLGDGAAVLLDVGGGGRRDDVDEEELAGCRASVGHELEVAGERLAVERAAGRAHAVRRRALGGVQECEAALRRAAARDALTGGVGDDDVRACDGRVRGCQHLEQQRAAGLRAGCADCDEREQRDGCGGDEAEAPSGHGAAAHLALPASTTAESYPKRYVRHGVRLTPR